MKIATLKNGWHKLWPVLMFTSASNENTVNDFTGFRVSKEKQLIQELLAYTKDGTNPAAKELASRINEDVVPNGCMLMIMYLQFIITLILKLYIWL